MYIFLSLLPGVIISSPIIRIGDGEIEGKTLESGVDVFHGIPFAAAPMRELRWKRYSLLLLLLCCCCCCCCFRQRSKCTAVEGGPGA